MYKITVNRILYTKENKRTKRQSILIETTTTTENNLSKRLIELKHIYKDFSYNIEFVRQ